MAETNPSNPESSRPKDQQRSNPPSEPEGAAAGADADDEAQKLRDTDDTSSQPAAETESGESAGQVAEDALETAERATQDIREQTGVEADSPDADAPGGDEAQADASANETPGTDKFDLPDFGQDAGGTNGQSADSSDLHLLDDIDLDVTVELGRTEMYVEDVLKLNENSVVELDKAAGDPVDIYVNNRHVARGEVLVLNEAFCVRISEIINQDDEV